MVAHSKQVRLIEAIAEMQRDVEAGHDEAVKRRRRLMLRGIRALANVMHYHGVDAMEEKLRDELFGIPPMPDRRLGSGK